MENFLLIPLLLAAGVGLRRLRVFPTETGQVLNMFVIYVSLPALVLIQVPRLPFSTDLWVPVAMPWFLLIPSIALVLILGRLLSWDRAIVGGLLLVVPLGNTSFLGLPMVETFFGKSHFVYALLYDQLGTFLALSTYGALVLAAYGGTEKLTVAAVLHRVVTFPPFIALLAGFVFRQWSYPEVVGGVLEPIAGTLVPVVMVAVGFQLSPKLPRGHLVPLGFGLVVKLVVAPALALGAVTALGLTGEATRIAVFEAGMPSMVTAGAMAMAAGLAAETMAAIVGVGILLSFATLPVLYLLL